MTSTPAPPSPHRHRSLMPPSIYATYTATSAATAAAAARLFGAALQRLLQPRHIALIGGGSAHEAVHQCQRLDYRGQLWPVHPKLKTVHGLPCYRSVHDLPEAPDASFIAVNADATIAQVRALAQRGAGGLVCYASGFAETGGAGVPKQQALLQAAAGLPLLGPNCYGMLNYLDGVALWPDQHGGERVSRGVAIITQSGNIGLNLTMQRRALPLAYLITLGNRAGCDYAQLITALLHDERVTAIGLHIEGLGDASAFARAALTALHKGVPLVVLKAGSSAQGTRITLSHTSSLSGSDQLHDALFARYGVARVHDLSALLETLKLLHVHGALSGASLISASCSGGEAALVADLAARHGLSLPPLPAAAQRSLQDVLGPRVHVANPLDYHTYIWGDLPAQTACFVAMMQCRFHQHLLVLDLPRADRCASASWHVTLQAFLAAQRQTGVKASVVSALPEGFPETLAGTLLQQGVAPLMGLQDAILAIALAAQIGHCQAHAACILAMPPLPVRTAAKTMVTLDEVQSKQVLAEHGVPIPPGRRLTYLELHTGAQDWVYPVALKAVSASLAHKSEHGAVRLNLGSHAQLLAAATELAPWHDGLLVESMIEGAVAELIVGLSYDAQFGLTLTLGAGGVWVELLHDRQTVLLPTTRLALRSALEQLRIAPVLHGYRGKPAGDIGATLDAIEAICRLAQNHADTLLELDVNPLLVLPEGRGCVAVDALIRFQESP